MSPSHRWRLMVAGVLQRHSLIAGHTEGDTALTTKITHSAGAHLIAPQYQTQPYVTVLAAATGAGSTLEWEVEITQRTPL